MVASIIVGIIFILLMTRFAFGAVILNLFDRDGKVKWRYNKL